MYECIWKKTLKRPVHGFKGFAKGDEVAKINKTVIEMANTFYLSVNEDDIEELPKGNCRRKENPPRNL